MTNIKLVLFACLLVLVGCDQTSEPQDSNDSSTPTITVSTDAPGHHVAELFGVGENVYVRSLAIEKETNTLWVGTSLGVHDVNLETQEVVQTFTRDHGLANEYVFAIGIDPDGYKWFGTNAGGMSRYKNGDWKTYFPMHGLADYWIYAFANDEDGGLWIGTWAGANYLDRKTGEFRTYVSELINEWVYGLAVDSQNRIWFGTEGGVSMYDHETWQSWNHDDGMGAENVEQLPFSRNTGLGTRARHDLGVLSEGEATYNPNYVFSVLSDINDLIWVGTWGGGVSFFDQHAWRNLTTKDGLAGNIVYSLTQDISGTYWFGTNRGLSRFDGTNWTNFNVHNGLPSNDIYAIATEDNGNVWIGTKGGVVRLEPDLETGDKK